MPPFQDGIWTETVFLTVAHLVNFGTERVNSFPSSYDYIWSSW